LCKKQNLPLYLQNINLCSTQQHLLSCQEHASLTRGGLVNIYHNEIRNSIIVTTIRTITTTFLVTTTLALEKPLNFFLIYQPFKSESLLASHRIVGYETGCTLQNLVGRSAY